MNSGVFTLSEKGFVPKLHRVLYMPCVDVLEMCCPNEKRNLTNDKVFAVYINCYFHCN